MAAKKNQGPKGKRKNHTTVDRRKGGREIDSKGGEYIRNRQASHERLSYIVPN